MSCKGYQAWSDFGNFSVHPWSFMWHIVLAMAAVMIFFWQSLGLDQKSCFLFFRPMSPNLTEKDKRNAFGNSILCCENSSKTCIPKVSWQEKRVENSAGCYSGGSVMADIQMWNMINFWWLLADLTIKIKSNFNLILYKSSQLTAHCLQHQTVYMTLSVNAFGIY